ncbi:tetratricopeptide repeat protein [Govanella unica]|uniref:Tetratricopeptide repeat protein n=1 Tax=Govanella unica TaxID=2975056 RepID=A0A9X3TVW1_9PROT|nr:tetratricopeptide repeat protein [Govania unica]MDA5192980.1 tetratricopeptide repeat protein [Govania unica]
MTKAWVAVVFGLLATGAVAQPSAPAPAYENPFQNLSRPDAARYKACLTQAETNPKAALEAGFLWKDHDGGVPAKHCIGAALAALDRYPEAAAWFEEAASDVSSGRGLEAKGVTGSPLLAARLRDQAGNAWMLSKHYDRAYKAFTEALALAPAKSVLAQDAVFDRALAAAALRNYKQAASDLTQVILADRERDDALTLRAAAHRALGETDLALADLGRALAINPENADALMERGNLRYEDGDHDGARLDWIHVLVFDPGSDLADQALDNLEMLRIKG